MTLDDLLKRLVENPSAVTREAVVLYGHVRLKGGGKAEVIGVHGGAPLGIEDALKLSGRVLEVIETGGDAPILALIDGASQRMSKRDELLGLNGYLAHLGKTLIFAGVQGRRTLGVVYGGAAAGAFIATALSTLELVAIEGAHPEVMDLPSMSKVTKLPLDVLKKKAEATAVFAPGVDNLVEVGAVLEVWKASDDLAAKLAERLAATRPETDERDHLGQTRGGRPKAAAIAREVEERALAHG
jgi:malonate decarboxylase gamma subunit